MGLLFGLVIAALLMVAARYAYNTFLSTPSMDDIRKSMATPNENAPETTDLSDTQFAAPPPPPNNVVVEDKGVTVNKNDTSAAAVVVEPAVVVVEPPAVVQAASTTVSSAVEPAAELEAPVPAPAPAPEPAPAPAPAYITPSATLTEARIELFTQKNFTGDSVTRYAGQAQAFAIMNAAGGIEWKYQSMKITPGTRIALQATEYGSPRYQKFAVGKYDVPDMLEFINLYNWYSDGGLFMTHSWWPNREFRVQVLNDSYDDNIIPYIKCTGTKMGLGMPELSAARSCFKEHPNYSLVITA